MKITKERLKQIIKEEFEAVSVEEAVDMPVKAMAGDNLTDSDMQFIVSHFKQQLEDLDQSVEDLSDVAVMNRDKINTMKSVMQKMLGMLKNNQGL